MNAVKKGTKGPNIELTVFESAGTLTKRISLAEDGSVQGVPSDVMSKGKAWRAKVSGVEQFAELINNLTSKQAIALGALREDLADEVKVTVKRKLNGASGSTTYG